MKNENVQDQIDSVNTKLDLILEEIEHQKRHRKEMEDLKDDLMRVGTGIYQTAITELEELHDHTSGDDLLFLGKKLLRNINNITQTFELLENAKGFLQDFNPVSRELIFDAMKKFDEFDRKGYFEFIKELEKVADKVVTSFSVEDVKALAENIVTILNTIKNLTQPDMLKALNNAVLVYNKLDINIEDDISYMKLIKELKTPEMKKGLAFGIKYLKSLSEEKSINHNN
jgi:uncharacterized protein YjgD (DUF1641 family)